MLVDLEQIKFLVNLIRAGAILTESANFGVERSKIFLTAVFIWTVHIFAGFF